ncbi:sensor domain-containing diguanylate cyclase [Methylobacterium platani]|uniref:diguanylate cyclase n=2 Tax=Methylobacterium platani TaxID=427683 RepID=A0A179SGI0_9HYPH|nr:sensor domain-containing diguanylate cyclase [Methylobacterium platani]KMO11627.1 dethiobiotin synthetase [Methylobacterium platani JCM 14648]OAS27016.1 dethiobiotin synthetase [Methylobacterium platani]
MSLPRRFLAGLQTAQVWIVLGVLAPLGMLLVSGFMLYDLRRDMWARADEASRSLLQVIETDIARNVAVTDLALRGMVEKVQSPLVAAAPEALRRLVLFDPVATADGAGVLVLFDEHGYGILNSRYPSGAGGSFADRDYFQVHRLNPEAGLYISKPFESRMSGAYTVAFSRRISKPDGSFGGVAVATLRLSHFTRLLARVGLERGSSINLIRQDGIQIVRFPYDVRDVGTDIGGTSSLRRVIAERQGRFTARAHRDGVLRRYTFTQVGDLPLFLSIGISTEEIEAGWRAKAVMIGVTLLALFGLAVLLALLCGRELRRRSAVEAELARLSLTDGLTGLPNRRRFDEALRRAAEDARDDRPLALLIVDADHFKRFNDRHGHAVGDEILRGLAQHLTAAIHRPHDLLCRIGGEEFAVILPETDAEGAARVAERLHAAAAAVSVGPAGIPAGAVTVSIGLAVAVGPRAQAELYRAADAALYAAKNAGRDRTCRAESCRADTRPAAHLRLVATASGTAAAP